MDISHVPLILQSVSTLVLAGGVTFAAVQFRHWRRVALTANFTKLVELQMDLRKMRVTDPSLASIYSHDVKDMTSDREIREYFMNLMQLSVFEIVWFNHKQGLLPDDYFESWVKRIRDIQQEESFRKMFNNPAMKIMHDDFQEMVRSMMDESGR
ncbi:MAG: hypothetical protein AB7G11_03995 [Phycisphaerales bacterium]